jgi:hypothetical protein
MKHLLLSFIFLLGHAGMALGQERLIENHGFGIFTAEDGRTVLYLRNEECIGGYKVANGEVILGEGKVDFRHEPSFEIPFGGKELVVSCVGGDRLRVVVR